MDASNIPGVSNGFVFVERDGSYELTSFDSLKTNERTFWGQYQGVSMVNGEFYHTFLKQTWNSMTEQYEGTASLISITAIVHPRAKIHHDVVIEPKAIVGENVELLAGARVSKSMVIEPNTQYHHLTTDTSPLMNSIAA